MDRMSKEKPGGYNMMVDSCMYDSRRRVFKASGLNY